MNVYFILLQLLILLPMIAVVVLSHRTSRAHRSRQGGFLGVAFMLGLVAAVTALCSLALAFGGEEPIDPVLSFVPPVLTLAAAAVVARRGLTRRRTRRLQRG